MVQQVNRVVIVASLTTVDGVVAHGILHDKRIGIRVAEHRVGAWACVDGVIACTAADAVIASATKNGVTAIAAQKRIVAAFGRNPVVAIAAIGKVVTSPHGQGVVAHAAKSSVISGRSKDIVIAGACIDAVVACACGDAVITSFTEQAVIACPALQRVSPVTCIGGGAIGGAACVEQIVLRGQREGFDFREDDLFRPRTGDATGLIAREAHRDANALAGQINPVKV